MSLRLLCLTLSICLAACSSQAPRVVSSAPEAQVPPPVEQKLNLKTPIYVFKKGGGFYKDDGPGDNAPSPEVLAATPDAVPKKEPLHRFANNPYSVLGRDYVPMKRIQPYRAHGVASWYGRKFNGQRTSSGEAYDMFGMSAAHCTLPIPSYVRVSNPANGKSVVVRVNDRGPFHSERLIDLSYTAAWKLGLVANGSGEVDVELIEPGSELPPLAATKPAPEPNPAPQPAPLALAAAAPGAYVQLGAFGNAENADAFRAHIARELDWLADRLRLERAGKILRVQAGPFRDRAEAEKIADQVGLSLGVKPTVVMR